VATISRLLKITGLSFAKEPCQRDDIRQKRPVILRSLVIVATPYNSNKRPVLGRNPTARNLLGRYGTQQIQMTIEFVRIEFVTDESGVQGGS